MDPRESISRRNFLRKVGVGAGALFLAACSPKTSTPEPTPASTLLPENPTLVPPTRTPEVHSLNPTSTPTSVVEATAAPSITPEPGLIAQLPKDIVKAIHMGSISIDNTQYLQEEFLADPAYVESKFAAAIDAVSVNMPDITHIAIGTFLDYPGQIELWTKLIHAAGKKAWLRSAGFNSWQGTNGAVANTTLDQHRANSSTWLDEHKDLFQPGDLVESVPDELENGSPWTRNGIAGHKEEANFYVQKSILVAKQKLDPNIGVGFVGTNPSVTKDVITTGTAELLDFMLTDNYPPASNGEYAAAITNELTQWAVESRHADKPWHVTYNPQIEVDLPEEELTEAWKVGLAAIAQLHIDKQLKLHGVTLWQFGDEGNSFPSRLFDYRSNNWVPRPAVAAINAAFAG